MGSFKVNSELSSVKIFLRVENGILGIRTLAPIKASEDKRAAMAEYLLRANYGMKLGGFDFDFNDGEISFRVYLYCPDSVPTHAQIDRALRVSVAMIDRYGDGMLKVINGNEEPAKVIQEIEGK